MLQVKVRRLIFASLVGLMLVLGNAGTSLAVPIPGSDGETEASAGPLVDIDSQEDMVTVQTGAGPLVTAAANVLHKTIDLTKGYPASDRPAGIPTIKVYCTANDMFPGCLAPPELSWNVLACEGEVLPLDIMYVNENRRQAPVDTSEGDFTDTGLIPAATWAGPGVYVLHFRFAPSRRIVVSSGWEPQPRLSIGQISLPTETICS